MTSSPFGDRVYRVRTKRTTYRTVAFSTHIHSVTRIDDNTVKSKCGLTGPATSAELNCVTCPGCAS
ncbi:hypothetical protein [Microbispora sp. NPDC049125]|uniref:hypothetical protein n=1 Tax=Microbispora sp. NPDC049125 TaxID=3154929 RepID=UPI00346580E3